jgi:hypothetical protein
MRNASLMVALLTGVIWSGVAAAQSTTPSPPAPQGTACPPDVQGSPPTVGGAPTPDLSDKLADSKGVICPRAGIDSEIRVAPPGGGELRVIPPPGSPGGNPNVQPK